jgi:hypothetical protein
MGLFKRIKDFVDYENSDEYKEHQKWCAEMGKKIAAADERIAKKQAYYDELCEATEKAKGVVENLEKAVKFLDN